MEETIKNALFDIKRMDVRLDAIVDRIDEAIAGDGVISGDDLFRMYMDSIDVATISSDLMKVLGGAYRDRVE